MREFGALRGTLSVARGKLQIITGIVTGILIDVFLLQFTLNTNFTMSNYT